MGGLKIIKSEREMIEWRIETRKGLGLPYEKELQELNTINFLLKEHYDPLKIKRSGSESK